MERLIVLMRSRSFSWMFRHETDTRKLQRSIHVIEKGGAINVPPI